MFLVSRIWSDPVLHFSSIRLTLTCLSFLQSIISNFQFGHWKWAQDYKSPGLNFQCPQKLKVTKWHVKSTYLLKARGKIRSFHKVVAACDICFITMFFTECLMRGSIIEYWENWISKEFLFLTFNLQSDIVEWNQIFNLQSDIVEWNHTSCSDVVTSGIFQSGIDPTNSTCKSEKEMVSFIPLFSSLQLSHGHFMHMDYVDTCT